MEFINDGKIESITGIYTENTDVTTPNYILKPIRGFTHKHIVQTARLYCRMITGEQFEVMRGNMTFDLETIPLKDVPVGGLFIANKYEVGMGWWLNTFDVYVKVGIGIRDFTIFTILDGSIPSTFCGFPDSQVAYTGIILND